MLDTTEQYYYSDFRYLDNKCKNCGNIITYKIITDENEVEGEVEVGHEDECIKL